MWFVFISPDNSHIASPWPPVWFGMTGCLPENIGKLKKLMMLNLENNRLEGWHLYASMVSTYEWCVHSSFHFLIVSSQIHAVSAIAHKRRHFMLSSNIISCFRSQVQFRARSWTFPTSETSTSIATPSAVSKGQYWFSPFQSLVPAIKFKFTIFPHVKMYSHRSYKNASLHSF